ncbi:MAG: ATP-binding protein [Candidatus Thorarchaeota archaeon]|jgi:Pyruvate/2-oxoacid:ferredoxin oxidoreductase delta subunit/DNA-binding transcriptional ArsR family regulator
MTAETSDPIMNDVYRALQRHLDSMPVGFPPTESGVEIRILKRLFTPDEAKLAINLTYSTHASETLNEIFQRLKKTGISHEELEQTLDTMVGKGLLHFKREGKTKFYSNAQWVVGIFEFQVNKLTKELLADISKYNAEAFSRELFTSRPTQLRVIPIGKSITPENTVANYDDIRVLMESVDGPFMVTNCICRQSDSLAGVPCKATDRDETCLAFGSFAQMYIDEGWGREISKTELLEIISKNESDGLVLQPSNSEKLEFICSCCGCCCGIISGKKRMNKPVEFFTTNFQAEVDNDVCTSCETCVELCQMEALSMLDDTLSINLNRCIGCGICVANCPEDAINLQKRKEEKIPPQTLDDLYAKIIDRKAQ